MGATAFAGRCTGLSVACCGASVELLREDGRNRHDGEGGHADEERVSEERFHQEINQRRLLTAT